MKHFRRCRHIKMLWVVDLDATFVSLLEEEERRSCSSMHTITKNFKSSPTIQLAPPLLPSLDFPHLKWYGKVLKKQAKLFLLSHRIEEMG